MIELITEAVYSLSVTVILFWALLVAKPPLYVNVAAGVGVVAFLSQFMGAFL